MNRMTLHLLLGLALTSTLAIEMRGQAGVWVFDGWPHEKNGYFAGQTEVLVDGARVRITEWPEDSEDPSLALVTYHLGASVVKVFPWNGERVALVFEADAPMPALPNGRGWTTPAACAISSLRSRGGDALWRRVHLPRSEQRLHRRLIQRCWRQAVRWPTPSCPTPPWSC